MKKSSASSVHNTKETGDFFISILERKKKVNQNNGVAFKVWSVLYPVGMYYVAMTMGSFVAQVILGAGIETYMLCKIIGSLVAIPVVWSFYKQDLIFEGTYRLKQEFNKEFWKNIELLDKQINESNIEKSFSGIEYIKTIKQFNNYKLH